MATCDALIAVFRSDINYWSKIDFAGIFDLFDMENVVTNSAEVARHNGELLSAKAVSVIRNHDAYLSDDDNEWQPLFLYYGASTSRSGEEHPQHTSLIRFFTANRLLLHSPCHYTRRLRRGRTLGRPSPVRKPLWRSHRPRRAKLLRARSHAGRLNRRLDVRH